MPKVRPPVGEPLVKLRLRGLNVQWPFSQLLLSGVKTKEVRRYALGYRSIANVCEDRCDHEMHRMVKRGWHGAFRNKCRQ